MNRVMAAGDAGWEPRHDPGRRPARYYPDEEWDDHEEFVGPSYRPPRGMSPGPSPYGGPPPLHNGYASDKGSSIGMPDTVGPTYLLEHLATFRVTEDSDLLFPADGMRRLLHMEKTSGIWTQKMQLRLDKSWVLILSHENEDIVEKFPIELIREPTAFTSDDPKELYNNIFIFIVAEDPKGTYTTSTEMHIFQCLRISAKDVVEDMKLCMSGNWRAVRGEDGPPRRSRTTSRDRIPPPPQEKAPEPPMHNGGYYGHFFSSGWAPELNDDVRDHRPDMKHRSRNREDYEYYHSKRHGGSPPPERYGRHPPFSESEVSGSESASGAEGSGSSQQWLAELRSRGAKVVQVTYPRTANNDKELTVVRGEYLEVIDDSRKWWKCCNSRHQVAHVPHTIVTPYTPDIPEGGRRYSSSDSDDSPPTPPPPRSKNKKKSKKAQKNKPPKAKTPIPTPPPPPPPDFTPASTVVQRSPRKVPANSQKIFAGSNETTELMNYELKEVLSEFRKRKPHIDVQKTPDVYIDNRSSPKDVQDWLEKKGFSERLRQQFDGVDGEKLFSLSKQQLQNFCGESEGSRLFSQITIQRNVSGYKTVNTFELKRILSEQRKRLEPDEADQVEANFNFLQGYGKSEAGSIYGASEAEQEIEDEEEEEEEQQPIVVRQPKKSSKPKPSPIPAPPKAATQPTPSTSKPAQPKSQPVKKTQPTSKKAPATGTLKDQIKKQRKMIIDKKKDYN